MYLFSKREASSYNNKLHVYVHLYVHVYCACQSPLESSTVCSWKQESGQKSNDVHRDTNVGGQHQVDMTRDFRC